MAKTQSFYPHYPLVHVRGTVVVNESCLSVCPTGHIVFHLSDSYLIGRTINMQPIHYGQTTAMFVYLLGLRIMCHIILEFKVIEDCFVSHMVFSLLLIRRLRVVPSIAKWDITMPDGVNYA